MSAKLFIDKADILKDDLDATRDKIQSSVKIQPPLNIESSEIFKAGNTITIPHYLLQYTTKVDCWLSTEDLMIESIYGERVFITYFEGWYNNNCLA